MASQPLKVEQTAASLGNEPIDMALNHGTYASERCAEALRKYNSMTAFRFFPGKENKPLREAIAQSCGVGVENVFVANGSGPLLKTCVPYVIEKRIRQSPKRMVKHLAFKRGFPIYTPRFTYFKVPHSASRIGLHFELFPLSAASGFKVDTADIEAALKRQDGFVYLANPNNPTGNILVTREQLIPLLDRYPNSVFMVDEAYVDYIPESEHQRFADLVPRYENLLVLRTFSFAHGLAAARIGYILAQKDLVTEFELKTTPHAVSDLASDLAVAALSDTDHIRFVQEEMARQRTFLIEGMRPFKGLEVYDSQTNFFLCRFTDGRTAHQLYQELMRRGLRIKIFEPVLDEIFDDYFRITVGLAEENQILLEQLQDILG